MKALKPPLFPPFVRTLVLCGNLPVKIDDRDGQQSESVTKYLENVTPSRCIATTFGMYCTRFIGRSSVSTKMMFGLAGPAPRPTGTGPPPEAAHTTARTAPATAATHFD